MAFNVLALYNLTNDCPRSPYKGGCGFATMRFSTLDEILRVIYVLTFPLKRFMLISLALNAHQQAQ